MAYELATAFHFRVDFGTSSGSHETLFQEVGGLGVEVTTEELVEGGENRFSHRLPVRATYGNLILKRGLLMGSELVGWIRNAVENIETEVGKHEPKTVTVTLLDQSAKPLAESYSFTKCWPVKWSLGDLNASDNAVAVETMELSYNYFSRVKSR